MSGKKKGVEKPATYQENFWQMRFKRKTIKLI
jgi:hypothetical protein